jgi:hypothetical protein
MKFMFSIVYRVTQKDFYAHPYTSMWAPDLRPRIIEAVELITPHMLIYTWQELKISVELQQGPTLKCRDVHKNLFELLCTLLKT